jgi:DNA-binding CsgD family transcriptional regulator
MDILSIILLIVAYTIGIATLIIQFVCYYRKIEYGITLLFSLSFLLLIMVLTIDQISLAFTKQINPVLDDLLVFPMLFLAVTTPLNIHTERKVSHVQLRNRIILISTTVMLGALIISYFLDFRKLIEYVVQVYFILTIAYSMLLIFFSRPGMLVKHREKLERISSRIFFMFFSIFFLSEFLSDRLSVFSEIPHGSFAIALFYIYLNLTKLLDDLKRLSLFKPNNSINQHVLARYNITQREKEVINLLIKGKSYKDVCHDLNISMPTVKTHISRTYRKMNINSKVELINLLNHS